MSNRSQDDLEDKKEGVAVEATDIDQLQVDAQVEKSLLRKLDMRIIPIAFVMYWWNAIDRNNLGNASSAGMPADLGFTGNQYTTLVSIFTACYAAFCVPMTLVSTIVGPRIALPVMMTAWGALAAISAAAPNFASMLTVRILLGICEAAFSPVMILYLTFFYTRSELAKRICAFYVCNGVSGAFSGLLSFGFFQIHSDKVYGWQLLFIAEGGATVLISLICAFFLPPRPDKCKFLSDDERHAARLRTLRDSSSAIDVKFSTGAFFASLREPTFYAYALIAFSYGVASGTASYFLPAILGRNGWSTVKVNLYTIAPNVFSAVCVIIAAVSSDRLRERSFHLIAALVMTFIGCMILVSEPKSIAVSYFSAFLIAGGAFVPPVIFHSWHNSNAFDENGRAFRTGALTFMANVSGIVSAQAFRKQWAPGYVPSLIIVASFEALAILSILLLRTYFALDNRSRNRAQGVNWASKDVPTVALVEGPRHPSFRWFC